MKLHTIKLSYDNDEIHGMNQTVRGIWNSLNAALKKHDYYNDINNGA